MQLCPVCKIDDATDEEMERYGMCFECELKAFESGEREIDSDEEEEMK